MSTSAEPATKTEPQNAPSDASECMHKHIADAHSINLYFHYSEAEAADLIRLSVSTLKRARRDDEIGYIQKGQKGIAYFGYQLVDFLTSRKSCPTPQNVFIK